MDEELDGSAEVETNEEVLPVDPQVNDDAPDHQPEADASPSVDDLASEMGWTPQDKWRGDPDKWKPAADFLRSTVDYNKGLTRKLSGMEDRLARMDRVSIQMAERAAEQARADAYAEHKRAVDEGDDAAALQAAQKLGRIGVEAPAQVAPPEVQDFVARHATWFNRDDEATRVAVQLADKYARLGYSAARQISAVERDMAKDFPEYFPQQQAPAPRPKAPVLATPGQRAAPKRGKGYDDLPDEAKRAAQESEKRGWGSKDEYAKIYFEENA